MSRWCLLLSFCGLLLGCSRAPLPLEHDAGMTTDSGMPTDSRDLANPGDQAVSPSADLAHAHDLGGDMGCEPNGGTCWQPSQCCSGYCALPVKRPAHSGARTPTPNEGGPGWCVGP
jgi:hypothetical protein